MVHDVLPSYAGSDSGGGLHDVCHVARVLACGCTLGFTRCLLVQSSEVTLPGTMRWLRCCGRVPRETGWVALLKERAGNLAKAAEVHRSIEGRPLSLGVAMVSNGNWGLLPAGLLRALVCDYAAFGLGGAKRHAAGTSSGSLLLCFPAANAAWRTG